MNLIAAFVFVLLINICILFALVLAHRYIVRLEKQAEHYMEREKAAVEALLASKGIRIEKPAPPATAAVVIAPEPEKVKAPKINRAAEKIEQEFDAGRREVSRVAHEFAQLVKMEEGE